MIESLPESAQEKVVEELRALVEDVREEVKWDDLITWGHIPRSLLQLEFSESLGF
jgi:hypothetical protein